MLGRGGVDEQVEAVVAERAGASFLRGFIVMDQKIALNMKD